MLKDLQKRLYVKLKAQMIDDGLPPVSWTTFFHRGQSGSCAGDPHSEMGEEGTRSKESNANASRREGVFGSVL